MDLNNSVRARLDQWRESSLAARSWQVFSFGKVIRARADGDYRALRHRERRLVRVDLGTDRTAGLAPE